MRDPIESGKGVGDAISAMSGKAARSVKKKLLNLEDEEE